jgi:hypothetical protein
MQLSTASASPPTTGGTEALVKELPKANQQK